MKLLLSIVLAVAALYAGFWVVASRGLDRGLQAGIAAAEAQGWRIETGSLTTGGFPSRFDVTARDLTVTAPDGGLVWQAPWVETAALSYRPNKVIAVFPPSQTLDIDGQRVTVESDGLRASVAVAPNTTLDLQTLTAEAQTLSLAFHTAAGLTAGRSLLAVRSLAPQTDTYETYISLNDMVPQSALPGLPAGAARLVADATLVLDAPLNRRAILPGRPQVTAVTLNKLDLTWGDLRLTGRGTLDVDAQGMPTGQLDLTAQGWEAVVDLLAATGVIAPQSVQTIRTLGGLMVRDGVLTLPLTFADGGMALGPIPLGAAPLIRLP